MTTATNKAIDEAQIRQLVDSWVSSVHAQDIDGLMTHYAPDSLTFDIMPPLEHRGTDAYRKLWEQCFPYFQGAVGFEIRDLSITTSDDVAFSHSLNRMTGTTIKGEKIDNWMRVTVCYRKLDGKWKVVHEHVSVPIDVETNQALFDLQP
jgi:uncharacterized protein (TIGR02246 family)